MLELNKIYNESCIGERGMALIADGSVDMVLCDLPYGTTDVKGWDKVIPMPKLWDQYKRIVKDTGSIVLFASQPFTSYVVISNPEMFRYEWIWNKTKGANFLNANCQPLKIHENILVFSKLPASPNKRGNALYNPQKTEGKSYVSSSGKRGGIMNGGSFKEGVGIELSGRHPVSIQEFKKDGKDHPTQKPVALGEHLIRTYTNAGDVVLDNTCGVGSFPVAAVNTGRNFIGFELDKGYYDIAVNRVEEAMKNVV